MVKAGHDPAAFLAHHDEASGGWMHSGHDRGKAIESFAKSTKKKRMTSYTSRERGKGTGR